MQRQSSRPTLYYATQNIVIPNDGREHSLKSIMEKMKCTWHGAPLCRCGSRATRRVGFLARSCPTCGVLHYRLHDGLLVPMAEETALALDRERKPLTAHDTALS